MKKTTPLKLTKQLSKYSALVAAISGVADASGQIVYTDISPDFGGGANSEYLLDLNNDGIDDFRIYNFNYSYTTSYSGYTSIDNNLFIQPLATGNQVLGEGAGSFAYPFVLNDGAVISNGVTGSWNENGLSSSSFNSLNYGSCNYGEWCDVTDGFLGLRFVVGGNTHYAWARLDVATEPDDYAIKDYAYNTTPDEAIEAGQQVLGLDNNNLANNVKIVSLNKSIALYNLPANTDYKLFSITGQSVMGGSINESNYVIEANAISSGIYVLELSDVATKAIIRKKVIL